MSTGYIRIRDDRPLKEAWTDEQFHDHIRMYQPQYENLPESLIPWPYRRASSPEPTHCPVCARLLVDRVWFALGRDDGYFEKFCAGGWPAGLRRVMFFLWSPHFSIALGRVRRYRRVSYDPISGEPMDGPAGGPR